MNIQSHSPAFTGKYKFQIGKGSFPQHKSMVICDCIEQVAKRKDKCNCKILPDGNFEVSTRHEQWSQRDQELIDNGLMQNSVTEHAGRTNRNNLLANLKQAFENKPTDLDIIPWDYNFKSLKK